MRVYREISDPGEFFHKAQLSLAGQTSKNSLLLGLASRFQFDSGECSFQGIYGVDSPDPENIYSLVSSRGGRGTFVCSPSQNLDGLFELVDACLLKGVKPEIGHADEETARLLKVCFEERGFETKTMMRQRVYHCTQPIAPADVDGLYMLQANLQNHSQVAETWAQGFYQEAMPHQSPESSRSHARERIEQNQLFLLHNNDTFLAMAAWARPLPEAVSLNFIYVPPESRGMGYGKAITYLLTKHMIEDHGYRETNLFTDLGNEVSNSLYQSVGYRHIGFSEMFSISSN